MRLWIIGIVCLVVLSIHVPAAAALESASAPSAASASGFRSSRQQPNAQFAQRIKDWFKKLKNRFTGKNNEPTTTTTTTSPSPEDRARQMMMELAKEDFPNVPRNSRGFYLDLSQLHFDPAKDWGFRLGKWYFIRKVSDSRERNYWKSSETTYPEWPLNEEGKQHNSHVSPPFTSAETLATSASTESETPVVTESEKPTTIPATSRETWSETIQTETTPVVDASVEYPEAKDNETYDKRRDQSAEVLGPK